ncbi:MAG: hypothetical protein ACRENE_08735 [Polyangiaceae bacterium]
MATSNKTAATSLADVQALIAGTQKHFPNGQFTFVNTAYTTATLVQALQSLADGLTALNVAHSSVKDGVAGLSALKAKLNPLVRAYVAYIRATFSDATTQLGDFGLQPPKVRQPLDTEKRAAATAKLRATRKARGTTSKKQKLAVKGDVTGVIVTPVTQPAPAATPASPATSAGPAPVATTPVVAPK